jgi:hypothetical protein
VHIFDEFSALCLLQAAEHGHTIVASVLAEDYFLLVLWISYFTLFGSHILFYLGFRFYFIWVVDFYLFAFALS